MSAPRLTARGATFAAGGRTLVGPVDLDVMPGYLTILVGPNGAGKSTLLRMLSGDIRPQAGEVRLGGVPLADWPAWRLAAKRAVLPQASQLAFPFRAREVVRLGVDGIGRGLSRADREAIVTTAMESCEVAHLAARSIDTLSGGECQRVHLARVLAQLEAGATIEPDQVLFLDEPTAGLDLRHQLALLELARARAAQGLAVFAVLHELHLALAHADRLVVMERGLIRGDGPVDAATPALVAEIFGVPQGAIPVVRAA